ncbi:hypothetical protein [Bradyrhizobium sp. JR4.1]|uniref:hypothetical protein n=1 Tax=Bradyrhizobium sp. JR4.1 TaxID=3156372 RepID=UPI0033955087
MAVPLICFNDDFEDSVRENRVAILKHFGGKSRLVALRQSDPMLGLDHLHEALAAIIDGEAKTVVIDSTTFTHEGLLILLRLLASCLREGDAIHIAYTPAADYALGSNAADKWLSRGLREIRSVLGFPGLMVPARDLHLIVLVGFEVERARMLIDSCEPDIVSLGSGRDATDSGKAHLPRNTESLRSLSVLYPNFLKFEFSSVDPIETEQALSRQVGLFPGKNTIIAPMNTKLSTIGAAVLAMKQREVQLCYAPAMTYNTPAYSSPCDFCYVTRLEIPLFDALKG